MVIYNFEFVFITSAVMSYLEPVESLLSSSQAMKEGAVDGNQENKDVRMRPKVMNVCVNVCMRSDQEENL